MRPTIVIRTVTVALVMALGASTPNAFALVAPPPPSPPPPAGDPWLAAAPDPGALQAALTANRAKLPGEFYERLEHVLDDGTLRVMAVTSHRDAAVEQFVADNTTTLRWYGGAARFMATVNQVQLLALVTAPVVTFVEPDYPIALSMATSTVDVKARSLRGDGTGVWSFDPSGERGGFRSDSPGLSADQATGKGVVVAVNDAGIDGTHKDFSGEACVPEPYEQCESRVLEHVVLDHVLEKDDGKVDNGKVDNGKRVPTSDYASGHGTHVSGTVAGNGYYSRDGENSVAVYGADGRTFGVAPQASLVSVKNGELASAALGVEGLQWTLENAERLGIKVSNNSWGCLGGCDYYPKSAFARLVKDLYDAGVLVVFAAGNDAGENDGSSFSGDSQSPYALSVAAYDDANGQLADFSSRGSSDAPAPDAATWDPDDTEPASGYRRPDLAAPGVSIWSARNLTGGYAALVPRVGTSDAIEGPTIGVRPYVEMSGTSMATPHVAGAAALLFGACPTARPLDVMRAMLVTASGRVTKTRLTEMEESTVKAEPFEVGYGALNVRPALDYLLTRPACGGTLENLLPDAVISAQSLAQPGETVSLDGSASRDRDGRIESYAWDFGDGATGTGARVSHAWQAPGSYTVTLRVADDRRGVAIATSRVEVSATEVAEGVTILEPPNGGTIEPGPTEVTGTVLPRGGGTLFLVGNGTDNNGVAAAAGDLGDVGGAGESRFTLSSSGPGTATSFATLGSWNVSFWDNPFLPTFVGDEAVELSGEPIGERIRLSIDVVYQAPAQSVYECPLTAQLFSGGAPLGDAVDVDAAPSASPQTLVFEFRPPAGSYRELGVQVGEGYVDCGWPATFQWGGERLGRLDLRSSDTLRRTPGPEAERVELAVDGEAVTTVPVDTTKGPATFAATVDMDRAGERDLTATWYDTYGTVVGTATSRVTVTASNRQPTAVIDGPSTADLDVEAAFDGSASSDPDGDPLTHLWDFGDGSLLASGATVRHAYATTGTYTVVLVVSDGRGGTATATKSVNVTVGDDPPRKGYKRIFAALDTADCGPEWHFIVTRVPGGRAADRVLATWDVGTSSVPLTAARSNVVHYRTSKHLSSSLQQASVQVPKKHRGEFFLALAPC